MSVSLLLCLQQLRWWFAKLLLTTHQSDHRDKMDQPECVLERFWPISVPVWNSPKRESSDSSLGLPVWPWPIRACALCKGKLKWTTVGKGVGKGVEGGVVGSFKVYASPPVWGYPDRRLAISSPGSRFEATACQTRSESCNFSRTFSKTADQQNFSQNKLFKNYFFLTFFFSKLGSR